MEQWGPWGKKEPMKGRKEMDRKIIISEFLHPTPRLYSSENRIVPGNWRHTYGLILMLGSETDEELGDTVVCKGERKADSLGECPGLQSPGNSVEGNAASRTLWRFQNRNKWRDARQDRGNSQRVLWCCLGMTRQLQDRNDGCWVWVESTAAAWATAVSRSLWWRDCRQFCIMAADLVLQRVIKCTSNSEKLVPFWQTRLFIYLSCIIIRMLTNLSSPLPMITPKQVLSLSAFSCRIHSFWGHH